MKKKVLLMGKSGSGKTSMRSIIFANYIARDTRRLGATIEVEHSHVRFLGNLVLNLWDCGGQEAFMENYFQSQRDHIFRNVEVLIYVFDVESREVDKDLQYYKSCLDAIRQNSKDAKIFCLIHKMDLLPELQKSEVFGGRRKALEDISNPLKIDCFGTSIWDETLYKAWSCIVYSLIPNVKQLEESLEFLCNICQADEVIVFERATFLVVSHVSQRPHSDQHRFEKISNIVKQFKLGCSKIQAQFQSMEVTNTKFSAYIDVLTANTFVMIVSSPGIRLAATKLNILTARKHFELIETVNNDQKGKGGLLTIESNTYNKAYSHGCAKNPSLVSIPEVAGISKPKIYRLRKTAPIMKLTVALGDTYLAIGKAFYYYHAKKRRLFPQEVPVQTSPSKRYRINDGVDDGHYNYIIRPGEIWNDKFRIMKILGKGSFGQVVEAFDIAEKKRVAIKIIKSRKAFYNQGMLEIKILKHLNERDPFDEKNIVRFINHFLFRNHLCLVYEILSFNLYELLKNDNFTGLSLDTVRKFSIQILSSLEYLCRSDIKIIHCDLKPENIVLLNPRGCQLKLIDFGSACFFEEKMYTYIQSRFYRSPEVLLGRTYGYQIDMWSLGCLLVELHTGYPLFNGKNENDQLCRIVEIMGEVPEKILKTSSQEKISKFFTVVPYLDSRGIHKVKYNLNWPPSLKRSTGLSISDIIMKIRQPIDRISVLASLTDEQKLTYELFVDLVLRMLDYDPDKRITPHEALKHPFCKISRGTLTHRSNSAKRKGNSSIEYLPPIGKLQL